MTRLDQLMIRALSPQDSPAGKPASPHFEPTAGAEGIRELYVWNRGTTSPRVRGEETRSQGVGRVAAATGTARHDFEPKWEVDAVRWPDACRRMELEQDELLGGLADALMNRVAREPRVIGLTGLHRGEGRTTLLLSLARQLAWKAPEFAIVDADWSRPAVARMLGLSLEHGWDQAVRGTVDFDEVCVRALRDHLLLVPLVHPLAAPPTRRQHQQLRELLVPVMANCRLVLVDLGPIGDIVHQLAPCDEIVVVRDVRDTPASEVARLLDKLQFAGLTTLGVIENFTDHDPQRQAVA